MVMMVMVWFVVGVVGRLVWNVDRVGNFNLDMLLADVLDLLVAFLLILNVFHRLVLRLTSEHLLSYYVPFYCREVLN